MFQFSIDQGNKEVKGRQEEMSLYAKHIAVNKYLCLTALWLHTRSCSSTRGLSEVKKVNMRIIQQPWLYWLASNPLGCLILDCLGGNNESRYVLGC